MTEEIIGKVQEFLVDCPGCNGSGVSELRAGDDKTCINCAGRGKKHLRIRVPKPGEKVSVKVGNESMLEEMFGLDDKDRPNVTPKTEGVVHNVVMPEEHHLELGPTGLGVNVHFGGKLKKDGSFPTTVHDIDLWMFDLYELKVPS